MSEVVGYSWSNNQQTICLNLRFKSCAKNMERVPACPLDPYNEASKALMRFFYVNISDLCFEGTVFKETWTIIYFIFKHCTPLVTNVAYVYINPSGPALTDSKNIVHPNPHLFPNMIFKKKNTLILLFINTRHFLYSHMVDWPPCTDIN